MSAIIFQAPLAVVACACLFALVSHAQTPAKPAARAPAAATGPFAKVPAFPTVCYAGNDPFVAKIEAAKNAAQAEIDTQKAVNATVVENFHNIDPMEMATRMQQWMMSNPQEATRYMQAADFDGTADLRKLERFEALWGQTNILLQPCEFTSEFVAHLASASVLAEEKALRDLARETDPAKARKLAAELVGRLDLWGPLPHLALWRSADSRESGSSTGRTCSTIAVASRS